MRALALAAAAAAMAANSVAYADLRIEHGRLVEEDGSAFLMRGVNETHAWTPESTTESLREIAEAGANSVRVALGAGAMFKRTPPSAVRRIIAEARRRKLILILEVHDTTGYPANERAVHLGATLPYWASLKPLLAGREDTVLINIGNEPFSSPDGPRWAEAHKTAIAALRAMGYRHTIVIDAPAWGQDAQTAMPKHAQEVFDADPLRNTLFSVHMYQVYGTEDRVRAYFDAFAASGLPLIVGEFGNDHQGEPVDEDAIFRLTQERGLGWLAWSWRGNGGVTDNLNMVTARPAQLSPWGERVVNGPHGLRETAKSARVFSGGKRR